MKQIVTIIGILVLALISACGDKQVSFDTLESARALAKSNAEWNATKFRANNPQYTNTAMEVQGDSSQTPDCPQGDGWASAKLIDRANPANKLALKCSTISSTIGCMAQTDFTAKPYAMDDGKCQPTTKVPFPLPKLDK